MLLPRQRPCCLRSPSHHRSGEATKSLRQSQQSLQWFARRPNRPSLRREVKRASFRWTHRDRAAWHIGSQLDDNYHDHEDHENHDAFQIIVPAMCYHLKAWRRLEEIRRLGDYLNNVLI